ncbi:failed axon connections-like [Ctenocephalides felis]|uniref:failed axon connections-like n=1 Tax=Ctenocephalides felis TaxID=7515 RepID=UPI000E6E4D92|nr:failed axon connections-like [Ctenocephalides felis]
MATEVVNNVQVTEKDVKEELPEKKIEEEAPATEKSEKADEAPASKTEPAPPKVLVHKTNFEKDTVYLYQFSRTPLLPSMSPYCLKVETWLRLAGIKYEVSSFLHGYIVLHLFLSTSTMIGVSFSKNCNYDRHCFI